MTWQKRLITLLLAVALGAGAWRAAGWAGVALLISGLVLWLLLYYTRLMQVMRRAAERPIGYVDSAVMLNARLQRGKSLLHVMALTRSMGESLTPPDAQPQVLCWRDAGDSRVVAEFVQGRLHAWWLERPQPPEAPQAPQNPTPAPSQAD